MGKKQKKRELALARAPREKQIVAGRPTDAAQRTAWQSWSFNGIVPRPNDRNFHAREGSSVLETLRIIRDRDPDAAQAINTMLLLMAQGYKSRATTGQQDADGNDVVDQRAQSYLSAFDARVGGDYGGGMDNIIDVINLTLATQGAESVELEISESLREVADVHPVDPARVVFKRDKAIDNGRLRRGIMVAANTEGADRDGFLELNPRQFRYIPYHPDIDAPYGRSPIMPALAAIFFKIQVLEDLRAVVHNQGYPRLDVSVVREVVLNAVPASLKRVGQEQELAKFVNGFLAEIQTQYQALRPDDTFIHWDSVAVNYATPGGAAIDIAALSDVIDHQITSGLKQLPSFLGRNEGSTTTHATVQFKIYMLLIESFQRRTKRMIEWIHTTALNVAGMQAVVRVEFETQPTSERQIESTALATEVNAYGASVDRGWITDDDAANELFGHPARGTPKPSPVPVPNDDPDDDQARRARRVRRTRAADPNDALKRDLESAIRARLAERFEQLAADYPIDSIVEQIVADGFDATAVEQAVAAWFASEPGTDWVASATADLVDHYVATANVAGQAGLDALGIAASFDLRNEGMLTYLRDLGGQRITGITVETRRQIVTALVEGSEAGEGVPQLGRRIRTLITDMSRRRAELIATTETATAFGYASLQTYQRNGVEQKSWLTTGDERVTEGCRANQRAGAIAVDRPFPSNHDAPPRFPGCRCAVLPIVEGFEPPADPWSGA